MDLDKVDVIIENLKDMLKSRGDNIDEFEEHEVEVEREDFFNDNRPVDFHTDNTAIIFVLTKNLRSIIIDNLKKNKNNIDGFIKEFNGKLNIILVLNNDLLTSPSITQLNNIDKMEIINNAIRIQFKH
jgi:hypothetical protein